MTASTAAITAAEVEILLFEVGGSRYGADAAQVLRVDQPRPGIRSVVALGAARDGARALIFESPTGVMNQLQVDVVHGIRTVPIAQLWRLPAGISPQALAIGVWLDGATPVLLMDLVGMVKLLGGQ